MPTKNPILVYSPAGAEFQTVSPATVTPTTVDEDEATSPSPIITYPGGGFAAGEFPPASVYSQSDITQLINGQSYIDVVFGSAQTTEDWVVVACEVENTTDSEPLNIWPGIVTDRSTAGFRLHLNGMPDSDNYYLRWAISGVNITPTPATTFILSGPASGIVGLPSTFTVHLSSSTTVPATVTVTPSDSGGGGVFSPLSVTLTTGAPSITFTYTPGSTGTKTISVTNDGGLINPSDVSLSVVPAATGYSLSGPSTGTVVVASTPFTVTLTPAGGALIGTATITPSDGGGGGTFTPTSVGLTTASPSATFTYTPASSGVKTVSTTNNGGLTNPGGATYTVTTDLAVNLVSYWKLDEASGTRNDSQGTNHLAAVNAPAGVTGKINNGAQFAQASANYVWIASNATLQVTVDFTLSVWVKLSAQTAVTFLIGKAEVGPGSDYSLIHDPGGNGFVFWTGPASLGSDFALTGPVSSAVWYHLVAWHDAATGQSHIKVNNAVTYSSTTSPALIQTAAKFMIGGRTDATIASVDGIIDEVGFWKRILTAGEIAALYNGGAGLPFSSF